MSTHICENCNNQFTGQFCNNCGQKLVHRLTMSHLWHDLAHAFTHTDKGFFYMMGQLFVRPGIVAQEYIVEGKRKRYFLPLQYLVILGTIATIIVVNSHYMENTMDSVNQFMGNDEALKSQPAIMQNVNLWMSKYYNIILFLQLPFYALAALFIYRKKYKYNYAEMLTLQTFVTAQTTLITTLLMLFSFYSKSFINSLNAIMIVASIFYQTWMYMQFFKEKSIVGFLKALGSYLLGIILFTIFVMIIALLLSIIIKIIS